MSLVTTTVTAGYTFVKDAQNRILILMDRLNSLGLPTVIVDMADAIATADLTTALANFIGYPTFSVAAESSDAISVTIQMKNAKAENLASVQALRVWLSDTSKGGETATTPSTGFTVTTGTQLKEVTASEHLMVLTNASGVAVVKADQTGGATHTWYVCAAGNDGVVYASSALAITI